MKFLPYLIISFIGFSLFPQTCKAQNQAPVISNVSATVNWTQGFINIDFDANDAESDPLEIRLKISGDGGKTFQYPTSVLTGNIGFPINPGTGKNIQWNYASSITDFSQFVFLIEACDRQPVDIQNIVNQIDSSALYTDVSFIQGVRHRSAGVGHLQAVRDSIEQRFQRHQLHPWVQNFNFSGFIGKNIIGQIPGIESEDTVYIMDAHYDGVAAGPAADDNGSGTAGVLEAVRVLSQYSFDKTVRFIGFDMEEAGLVGSIRYLTVGGVSNLDKIDGVINYEMIGYYTNKVNSQTAPTGFSQLFPAAYATLQADSFRGNFISSVGNTNSNSLNAVFNSNAAQYVPQLKVIELSVPGNGQIAPDFRRSDHAPFWDANKKALMITDGANFRNHNYHTATDVKDSLDFGFMSNVVKASVATIASLAGPRHSDFVYFQVNNPTEIDEAVINCDFSAGYRSLSNSLHLTIPNCISGNISITLLNTSGEKVYRKESIRSKSKLELQIPVELSSGIYFVNISTKEGRELNEKIWID